MNRNKEGQDAIKFRNFILKKNYLPTMNYTNTKYYQEWELIFISQQTDELDKN